MQHEYPDTCLTIDMLSLFLLMRNTGSTKEKEKQEPRHKYFANIFNFFS